MIPRCKLPSIIFRCPLVWLIGGEHTHLRYRYINIYQASKDRILTRRPLSTANTLVFFKNSRPPSSIPQRHNLPPHRAALIPQKRFAARFPSLLPLFCSVETGRNAHAQSIVRFHRASTACRVGGTSNVPQELKKRSGEKAAVRPLLRNRGIIIIAKSGKK